MKIEDLKQLKNKKVKIVLKNGFFYTCEIEYLTEDSVHVIDKFNQKHIFDISAISEVGENGGDYK